VLKTVHAAIDAVTILGLDISNNHGVSNLKLTDDNLTKIQNNTEYHASVHTMLS